MPGPIGRTAPPIRGPEPAFRRPKDGCDNDGPDASVGAFEYLVDQRIDRLMAGDRNLLRGLGHPVGVGPDLQRQKSLGFDIVRIVLDDRFEIVNVSPSRSVLSGAAW